MCASVNPFTFIPSFSKDQYNKTLNMLFILHNNAANLLLYNVVLCCVVLCYCMSCVVLCEAFACSSFLIQQKLVRGHLNERDCNTA